MHVGWFLTPKLRLLAFCGPVKTLYHDHDEPYTFGGPLIIIGDGSFTDLVPSCPCCGSNKTLVSSEKWRSVATEGSLSSVNSCEIA